MSVTRAKAVSAGVAALTMGVVAMAVTPASADPDLWGHLRFGLDLIDTRDLYRADIYSFLTVGVPWINHEWLSELLFAIAWRLGDGVGLVLLKAIVSLAAFAIVYRHLVRRGLGVFAASILLLQAIPLTLPWISVIRPQIFTYLGVAITLTAIARAEHGAPRALWTLPILFVCWPNLHGGVIAGLGLIGLWLMARAVACLAEPSPVTAWMRERALWLPACVAIASTVVNPYAAEMWLFFRTALVSRLEISEWNPLEVMGLEGAAHLLLLAPIAAGWFWSRREKRPALIFLTICLAALPVVARRNTPLFALGLVLLGGEHLADAASRLVEAWRARRGRVSEPAPTPLVADEAALGPALEPALGAPPVASPAPAWLAVPFFVAAAATFVVAGSDTRITFARADYPVEAVALMRQSGIRTNLAVPMNWGEYVLWHVGPDIKVSMDGRRETVYTDAGYLEVMDFTFGRGDWDRLLRRPGVDLALVPTADWPAFNLMKLQPGWHALLVDDRSALFGRDGSAAAAAIAALPKPRALGKLLTFP